MNRKRIAAAILSLCLICFALPGMAEVESPRGQIEYYNNQSGKLCVVLCQELTVWDAPSYEASTLSPLTFGSEFTSTTKDGDWLNVILLKGGSKSGWVRAEYVLVDPAFYITEREYTLTVCPKTAACGLLQAPRYTAPPR